MKKTKELFGRIKNVLLISVVLFSLLILFSDIIYNNIFLTLIIKLIALINIYSFCSVNGERLLK